MHEGQGERLMPGPGLLGDPNPGGGLLALSPEDAVNAAYAAGGPDAAAAQQGLAALPAGLLDSFQFSGAQQVPGGLEASGGGQMSSSGQNFYPDNWRNIPGFYSAQDRNAQIGLVQDIQNLNQGTGPLGPAGPNYQPGVPNFGAGTLNDRG